MPLSVASTTVRCEAPLVVLAVAGFGLVVQNGGASRAEGLVLLGAMAVVLYLIARPQHGSARESEDTLAVHVVDLVAVGTSLPELVMVVQSARRSETGLIVGNILGSNIFNALVAGGAIGLVGAEGLDNPTLTSVGFTASVAIAIVAGIAVATRHEVTGREGVVLVCLYLALMPFLA